MVNGGQGKPHQAVFALGEPANADAGDLSVHMLFERHFAPALGHFRISVTTDPRAAESSALPPDVEAALAVPISDRTPEQRNRVFCHWLSVTPELAEARKEIDRVRDSAPKPPTT